MTRTAGGAFLTCLEALQPGSPLFLQIYKTVRAAILAGRMAPGSRLPSSRTLARDLRVSRTTTEAALAQLLAEGFVERRIGAGTFVAKVDTAHRPLTATRRKRHVEPRRLAARAASLARHPCFPDPVAPKPFAAGLPAVDAFPIDTWRKLVARSLRHSEHRALGTCDPAGFLPLREAIASYLAVARGVVCTPERVVILTSSQQALDLSIRLLVDPGDETWIEEPGYPGARAALRANGAELVPVPVDTHGMRVEEGVRRAPQGRLAYVTPSHQYPLGVTLSLARRLALLDWARQHRSWILEDDYDSEFRYDERPLAAIQGIDQDDCVIYFGTFSKVMFPALRLAYVVVPADLVEPFVTARGLSDGHPPSSTQIALTEFFAQGHFGAHIRRMRDLYRERRDALSSAAARWFDGRLQLGPTDSGLHAVAHLRESDDRALSARLARAGIDAQALSRYSLGSPSVRGLFLGYAALKPREIQEGIRRIAAVV
jgi:GntR family transcriptional regulator / MocR family aminotransferase